jgi:hypothetical protein
MSREIKFKIGFKKSGYIYWQILTIDEIRCNLSAFNGTKPDYYLECVGEKDKKGNDIYEGDLVSLWYKNPKNPLSKRELVTCEIIWNKSCGMWSLKWTDGYINNAPLMPDNYEVIGNIYDDNDKLKKQ